MYPTLLLCHKCLCLETALFYRYLRDGPTIPCPGFHASRLIVKQQCLKQVLLNKHQEIDFRIHRSNAAEDAGNSEGKKLCEKERIDLMVDLEELEELERAMGSLVRKMKRMKRSARERAERKEERPERALPKSRSLPKTAGPQRKRKRSQKPDNPSIRDQPTRKRPRSLPSGSGSKENTFDQRAASDIGENSTPIKFWTWTGKWPKEYFEQDSQLREELEQDSWLEEIMEYSTQDIQYVEINGYRYPRPIRKVPTSLRRKQSDSSLTGSSDQKKRESKSVAYRDTRYTTLLEGKGSFMDKSDLNITDASKSLCRRLLDLKQDVPKDSLFRDDLFEKTCRKIQDRNETRVIQDISRLIVPSAETLATYGATNLDLLIEGANEGWIGGIPVQGFPRPQPDYFVGFRRSAFTVEQLNKLDPLIGSVFDTSFFVATYRIYFPFLTCEVKCGAAALDVADRQNAHSMTVAVKGIVELFKAVKREKELHREILAFSISHDHRSVRIYGHYAIIDDGKTTFWRHPIHDFSFTALDGRDKWTAYKFTKNIYDTWMPILHKRICSAIDELPPDINFDLSQAASLLQSAPPSSQQSNAEHTRMPEEDDSQSSLVGSQEVTSTTSFSQTTQRASKKPRNQGAAGQQR